MPQTCINIEMSSRLFFSMWRNHSWSFHSCADSEGQVLARQHARLTHNYQSRHNSEADLRSNEPRPVNVTGEQWIQESQNAVKQCGPQHWSDESSKHERPARKHRKHRTIEQSNRG